MIRKLTVLALAAAALALVALPAQAKGFSGADITGPGLPSGGIRITGNSAGHLWDTGIVEETKDAPPSASGISTAELGPRYRITYIPERFTAAPQRPRPYQFLYPYAKNGVWTYTPSGQTTAELGSLRPGWWVTPDDFLAFLIRQGLPAKSTVAAAAGAAAGGANAGRAETRPSATPSPASSPAWPWVLGATLVAAALAAGAVLLSRARARTVRAS